MTEQGDTRPLVRPKTAGPRRWAIPRAGPFRFAAGGFGNASLIVGATFEREMDGGRGFLWLPVAFGLGILIYFALPREPALWATGLLFAALLAAAWRRRAAAGSRLLLVAATIAAGLFVAEVRTDLVAAPVLPRETTATIRGWIAGIEETTRGGRRVTLAVHDIEGVAAEATPRRARVTVQTRADTLAFGDAVAVKARLSPPGGPAMPGGYAFSLPLFYQRLGATGFAFGAASPAEIGPPPLAVRLLRPLAGLRELIRTRVEAALPGENGHIAAALIMGDQRGISDDTQQAMRASGLGHILSISGLHLALVAGSVFWLVRALLALSQRLALTRPIKKWAAAAALAVATFYLGLSGAEVATVRSWLMLAIMLTAILLDRRALTLRNIALAAFAILIFTPEALLSISFQMSFAATVALIAGFEAMARRSDRRLRVPRNAIVAGAISATSGLLATSLLAGLATAPFALFHFQRLAPLTLVANMAVAPAIGLVVMPAALVAVLAMPFGLEAWPLAAMAWGLDWMVAVAKATERWSGGLGNIPAPPLAALLLAVAGFLWLTLWRERWRLAGLVPILIALPLAAAAPRPAVLIDEDAKAVAVRGDDGRLHILGGKGAAFEVQYWLRADGDPRAADAADLGDGIACDQLGCTGHAGGRMVSLARRAEAFLDDCRLANVIVSLRTAPEDCRDGRTVVDGPALARYGAHALYAEGDGFRVETAYPAVRRPFMPPAPGEVQ